MTRGHRRGRGTTLMIATVILHQMRVYFTGAYRKPRELNWMVGMTIMIATLMLGGEAYNEHTLPRFFVLHAAVLPMLLMLLVGIHIALIRLQGISEMSFEDEDPKEGKKTFDFFPDHLYTELIMGLGLMIVLSALPTLLPATLGPKANPLVTPEVIKSEWFFYVAFRWLKLFSGTIALLSTGFIVFIMFTWPFIDRWFRRRTRFPEASVWIGIVGVIAIVTLTLWESLVAH